MGAKSHETQATGGESGDDASRPRENLDELSVSARCGLIEGACATPPACAEFFIRERICPFGPRHLNRVMHSYTEFTSSKQWTSDARSELSPELSSKLCCQSVVLSAGSLNTSAGQ